MSDKLVNIITCDNMKADVVLLADGKITVMEFSQMHKKIEELEASNKEMLAELESNMRLCRYRTYHSCDGCVLNESCSLRKVIDRAKGLQQ